MAQSGLLSTKDEFRNVSSGWIGVVSIDGRGDHHGVAVAPGDTVWLSEEEQIATANAPRNDEDNPFLPQEQPVFDDEGNKTGTLMRPVLELVTRSVEIRNRRPFGAVEVDEAPAADDKVEKAVVADEKPAMTGATPLPAGEPVTGAAAAGEEVATPEATKPRRRKATAKA